MGCIKVNILVFPSISMSVHPICSMGLGFIQLFCKEGPLYITFKGESQKIFVKK